MSQLRRNRLLLLAALALLGAAVGITIGVLSPRGFVRARQLAWGLGATPARLAGFGNRAGDRWCGIEAGAELRQPLRGCHSYQPPEIVDVQGRRLVVWEHDDDHVAVSRLGPGLTLVDTALVPRPRTEAGTLLPRTGVEVDGGRLGIRYWGDRVVVVDRDLRVWPGGATEVAGVLLGSKAFVVLFGLIALFSFTLAAAGWTFGLPGRLRTSRARGRCLEATLPEAGGAVVIDGRPWELDLRGILPRLADLGGGRAERLAGQKVTLILAKSQRVGDAYRTNDRLRVAQLWPGGYADALARARAVRMGAAALAVFASAVILLGLDAYLAL